MPEELTTLLKSNQQSTPVWSTQGQGIELKSKKSPLVSVIVPTYNAENTIERALDSIEIQAYKNKEIVLVDDGSKDHTKEVVLAYMKSHPALKMKFIQLPANTGYAAASRNVGIGQSDRNSQIIMFLDDDDYYNNELSMNVLVDPIRKDKNKLASIGDYIQSNRMGIRSKSHFIQEHNGERSVPELTWDQAFKTPTMLGALAIRKDLAEIPYFKEWGEDFGAYFYLFEAAAKKQKPLKESISLVPHYIYTWDQRPNSLITTRGSLVKKMETTNRIFLHCLDQPGLKNIPEGAARLKALYKEFFTFAASGETSPSKRAALVDYAITNLLAADEPDEMRADLQKFSIKRIIKTQIPVPILSSIRKLAHLYYSKNQPVPRF